MYDSQVPHEFKWYVTFLYELSSAYISEEPEIYIGNRNKEAWMCSLRENTPPNTVNVHGIIILIFICTPS